jgi:hypothetical protein
LYPDAPGGKARVVPVESITPFRGSDWVLVLDDVAAGNVSPGLERFGA